MEHLIIQGKLANLNDLISVMNHNRFAGANVKKKNQMVVSRQLQNDIYKFPKDSMWYFVWHESSKKRDPDNVASAHKYVLDAMQEVGYIPNDNCTYVNQLHDYFRYDVPKEFEYLEIYVVTRKERDAINKKYVDFDYYIDIREDI